jgi:hypothetical protein
MTTSTAGDLDSAEASNRIRINSILLLTGLLGFFYIIVSWSFAIYLLAVPVIGAYFAIAGDIDIGTVVISVAAGIIVSGLGWCIARWIARGILEGRRLPAIVACILMIGSGAIGISLMFIQPASNQASSNLAGVGLQGSLTLVLAVLLIVSFRNRLYWGRAQ